MEARADLDANLGDPPGIVRLARICGMNDFKLKRALKDAFGTTIFGYVRRHRTECAAGHLHAGLPVAQAAIQTGYECPCCFRTALRRHFGTLSSEVMRAAPPTTPVRHG